MLAPGPGKTPLPLRHVRYSKKRKTAAPHQDCVSFSWIMRHSLDFIGQARFPSIVCLSRQASVLKPVTSICPKIGHFGHATGFSQVRFRAKAWSREDASPDGPARLLPPFPGSLPRFGEAQPGLCGPLLASCFEPLHARSSLRAETALNDPTIETCLTRTGARFAVRHG